MMDQAKQFVSRFAAVCNITTPNWSIVDKAGEDFLSINVGYINEIYTNALSLVRNEMGANNKYSEHVFLKKVTPKSWLKSHEIQLLQRILSESLTVGKATLDSDFHKKFIPFLGGEERRIYSEANHVVFGRRGAGKSSLVLYACHQAKRENRPFAWIALQQYSRRDDLLVIPQVLFEIVDAISEYAEADAIGSNGLKILLMSLKGRENSLLNEKSIKNYQYLHEIFCHSFVGLGIFICFWMTFTCYTQQYNLIFCQQSTRSHGETAFT